MGREELGYMTIHDVNRLRLHEYYDAHAYLDELERIAAEKKPDGA